MPTVFTHCVVALAASKLCARRTAPTRELWGWSIVCSILPDIDVLAFKFGIPYEAFWGHRGFTHSFAFAFLTALLVVFVLWREPRSRTANARLVVYFTLLTASHGLLDAATNGGLGIALLSPFDTTRYFLPLRPLEVSPIGGAFFSSRGAIVLVNEILWVWVPCVAVLLLLKLQTRRQQARQL